MQKCPARPKAEGGGEPANRRDEAVAMQPTIVRSPFSRRRDSSRRPRGAVALANEHLTGVGFDLPEVAPVLEDYVEHDGVHDRLRFAVGDFFVDDLPEADVVVIPE